MRSITRPRRSSLLLAFAGLIVVPVASVVPALAADPAPPVRWGINLDASNIPIYANVLRHSSNFAPVDVPYASAPPPLDAWGCPTTDFAVNLRLVEPKFGPNGDTFPVRFVGRADVACIRNGTVSGQSYNAAANVTTALLTIPAPTGDNSPLFYEGCWITFRNTRRSPADRAATGIDARRLTIMRPIAPGSAQHHDPSEKFNRQLKVALLPIKGPNGYYRDLDCGNANNVPNWVAQTPANRTPPYWPCQFATGTVIRGISLEDRIELANFLGCGWWHNVPDTATPALFQLTLDLVKFGSDESGNPYTAAGGANPVPPSGPVHPPLAGAFLFEQGNENWNFGFTQIGRYITRGRANLPFLYANSPGVGPVDGADLDPAFRQVAADLLVNADLARAAFPGGLNVKYFPIFASQVGNYPTYAAGLNWIKRQVAARGETLAQNISASGGAGYENAQLNLDLPGGSADSFFASGVAPSAGIVTDALAMPGYGVAYASYECGFYSGQDGDGPLSKLVTRDARMRPLVKARTLNMVAVGCRFITPYSLRRGAWTLLDSIHDLSAPKYLGWCDAIARYPCDGSPGVVDPAPAAPSLADGGFDAVRVSDPTGFAYAPGGSPWTFTPGGSGVAAQVSPFIRANQPVSSRTQAGFLQTGTTIAQSVVGWGPGSYRITGQASGRLGFALPSLDVLVDGTVVGTLAPQCRPNPINGQVYFEPLATAPFTPGPGTHVVTFRNSSTSGDRAVILDDLAILPAPSDRPPTANPRRSPR